jgi:hypothetical protein
MPASIRIVVAPGERLMGGHIASVLAEEWRAAGHRVCVGPVAALDADIGLLHLDRTVIPADLVPANPDRRPFLNASLRDISKRRVSRQLVTREMRDAGPVIVKTNTNAFGKPEWSRLPWYRQQRLRRRLADSRSWRYLRVLPPGDYPVLASVSDVPAWVWEREDLVVERFLSEREGDHFILRVWMFFGSRFYATKIYGSSPVVKSRTIVRYEYVEEVPEEIQAVRRDLSIDYGKIDFAIVDGRPVVYDVNKTPASPGASRSANVRRLAAGIEDYLQRG